MSFEWTVEMENFMESVEWVKAPGMGNEPYTCYLWEMFKEANEFLEANPTVKVFTLLDADSMVLVEGIHYVNRYAYLFTFDDVKFPDGIEEMVWWEDQEDEDDEDTD